MGVCTKGGEKDWPNRIVFGEAQIRAHNRGSGVKSKLLRSEEKLVSKTEGIDFSYVGHTYFTKKKQ